METTPKAQSIKGKINRLDSITITNFCSAKDGLQCALRSLGFLFKKKSDPAGLSTTRRVAKM